MSNTLQNATEGVLSLESPLEALRASPEFRGTVEPLEGTHCNDHFALIYETRAEQFAATIPFVRQGLERGEQCMYVVDDHSRAEVQMALEGAGVDVDAALESGALRFETTGNTYLRDGTFDADTMIGIYADAIEEATAEFEALRLAAEMTWVAEDGVTIEDFMAYESMVNELFDGEDAIALCQYNLEEFPPEVICDVIRVHPHLIYDTTVCHNFYYIPPEEFCGSEQPALEVTRMLGTLLDRTEAKSELQERERYLRRQHEITADPDRSFDEKLQALFELGCERFDLDVGGIARVDQENDRVTAEITSGDHEYFESEIDVPLSETFCADVIDAGGTVGISVAHDPSYEESTLYRTFGLQSYIGTHVAIEGDFDRTFFFLSSAPRDEPFSDDERTFLRSMGQWVTYELEQHRRERELERTVERLEASNERLEQFAYAASHDLQEPLRMVSSYLQLIERRAGGELSAETLEFLSFAVDGADRMRDMIEGLLNYSRVETQGEPFERVDLNAVLDQVSSDLSVRITERDATIVVESLPTVEGDASQLRQLFQNLLDNALEYSGTEPPRVHISAARDGPWWTISVRDEGIGIDADHQERIFEVFQRLHGRDEHSGTGIGLALCQRIVERHGGDIWVESEPGDGSTFFVLLPAIDR